MEQEKHQYINLYSIMRSILEKELTLMKWLQELDHGRIVIFKLEQVEKLLK